MMEGTKKAAKAVSKSGQPQQENHSRSDQSSPSTPKKKASDKSGGSRKARRKAKLKKIGRKIWQAMSWISTILGIACAVQELADNAGGGYDGGGGGEDYEEDA
ncbi:uncharacterized protein LOC114739400 [Neltuma alba]|uniref:uncharacterized protein LOC114739400 n=1 Tax=Neltuma alba TaxID=207710 RepID=UPI0010A33759|nr:uncharacterized protein LOC114739400 [Prosopis alba]